MVVEAIYELLRTGALKSGDRVPSEWQLVRELAVGRSAVREAMRELAAVGVIETQHGRGSFVRALPPEVMLTRDTFSEHLDRVMRAELWEVRRIFEPEAAALAATRATESDLTQLRNDVTALSAGVADRIRPPEDLKFHLDIVTATGNRSLARIATVIVSYYEHDKVVPTERDIIEHSAIFHAIKRSKPSEARRAMLEHLSHESVAAMGFPS
jgi:GntR family transcriptional repressor for pyruvate dehydrogenase complex